MEGALATKLIGEHIISLKLLNAKQMITYPHSFFACFFYKLYTWNKTSNTIKINLVK